MRSGWLARAVLTGLVWAGSALACAPAVAAVPPAEPLRYATLPGGQGAQGDAARLWQFSADPAAGVPQPVPLAHDVET
ncbi:DUF2300 domain-containing protein, partial [Ralstonia pseudosolanacearum]